MSQSLKLLQKSPKVCTVSALSMRNMLTSFIAPLKILLTVIKAIEPNKTLAVFNSPWDFSLPPSWMIPDYNSPFGSGFKIFQYSTKETALTGTKFLRRPNSCKNRLMGRSLSIARSSLRLCSASVVLLPARPWLLARLLWHILLLL